MPLEIVRSDITRMRVDAIVADAGPARDGEAVAADIHRDAGPELLAEYRARGGCKPGEAVLTGASRLPCRYVIHTVGPAWHGGAYGEEACLRACYLNALALAEERGCASVAVPLVAVGGDGYPVQLAAQVAVRSIRDWLADHEMTVYLVILEPQPFAVPALLQERVTAMIDTLPLPMMSARVEARPVEAFKRPAIKEARPEAVAPAKAVASAKETAQARKKLPLFRRKEKKSALPDGASFAYKDAMPSRLDDYLAQIDEGFRDMLLRKIDEKHMTDAECYKKANIDRKLFNKIKNQTDYRPGKSTVLALAVALRLPLEETREMLMKAGFSLSHSSKFDLIVEFFIREGNYDIYEINEALFSFDQKLLGSVAQEGGTPC